MDSEEIHFREYLKNGARLFNYCFIRFQNCRDQGKLGVVPGSIGHMTSFAVAGLTQRSRRVHGRYASCCTSVDCDGYL